MNKQYIPNMKLLIGLHNTTRKNNSWMWKINPLEADDKLMKYAIDWAENMASKNKLIHSKMKDIIRLGFNFVGENIAWGQKDESSVLNSWLWSPGHRANIMSTNYNSIGCGAAYSKYDKLYWCVCFGYK